LARIAKVLSVFLASPGDVAEERDIVEEVVQEFNITWGRKLGVLLELIRWESWSFAHAGIDAQAVINEELPQDYDIFIGILWTRFGTPTGRAGSGTEEEFDAAFARYKQSPESVRIMFYFSQEKELPKSEGDLQQLASVLKFKAKLGEQGVLYADYPNASEFEAVFRVHLTRQIQAWIAAEASPHDEGAHSPQEPKAEKSASQPPKVTSIGATPEDSAGMMDLMEVVLERVEVSTAAMLDIQRLQNELNESMALRTQEITSLSNPGLTPDRKEIKRVVNHVADAMNKFSDGVVQKTREMGDAYREAADAMSRAIPLSTDFGSRGRADLKTLVNALRPLQGQFGGMLGHVDSFKAVVERSPRATTALNRARRRTIDALNGFKDEIHSIIQLTEMMERTADETLNNWPEDLDATDDGEE
jgi:hypothetical protein